MRSFLLLVITVGLATGTGSSFCETHTALTSCLSSDAEATAFCQSYLSKTTSTITVVRTKQPVTTVVYTEGTTTTYVPRYVTASAPMGTQTVTAQGSGTLQSTCSRTTLTPYTRTETLPNGGPTIIQTFTGPVVRHDLAGATPGPCTPSCMYDQPFATISEACSCLSIKGSTTTVTSVTRAPTSTIYNVVTSGTYTYYYPTTTSIYGSTVTTTSTSYEATHTTYDLPRDSKYAVGSRNYNIYNDYRFDFDPTGITFYSCAYGLCDLQPSPCAISDCPNGLTDCLQVCPYVDGCTAVLYERDDLNGNHTCAFIDTRRNPLGCGYVDGNDAFGVQRRFAP